MGKIEDKPTQPSDPLGEILKNWGFEISEHDTPTLSTEEIALRSSNNLRGIRKVSVYEDGPTSGPFTPEDELQVIEKLCASAARWLFAEYGPQQWFERFRSISFELKNPQEMLNQVEEPVALGIAQQFAQDVMGLGKNSNILLFDAKLDPFLDNTLATIHLCAIYFSANIQSLNANKEAPTASQSFTAPATQCALLLMTVKNEAGQYLFPVSLAESSNAQDSQPQAGSDSFSVEKSQTPVLIACLGELVPREVWENPIPRIIFSSVKLLRE